MNGTRSEHRGAAINHTQLLEYMCLIFISSAFGILCCKPLVQGASQDRRPPLFSLSFNLKVTVNRWEIRRSSRLLRRSSNSLPGKL